MVHRAIRRLLAPVHRTLVIRVVSITTSRMRTALQLILKIAASYPADAVTTWTALALTMPTFARELTLPMAGGGGKIRR